MRRGGGLRLLRGVARTTKKAAKATDKAMPGAGPINIAAVVVGLLSGSALAMLFSAAMGTLGDSWHEWAIIIGAACGIPIAIGFNAWMVRGLTNLIAAGEILKGGKKK
jgi:hypothetical protein